jgi:hypothetical protein
LNCPVASLRFAAQLVALTSLLVPMALSAQVLQPETTRLDGWTGAGPVAPRGLSATVPFQMRPTVAYLAVSGNASAEAELQLHVEYGALSFLLPRQSAVKGEQTLHWRVPNADDLTTVSLSLIGTSMLEEIQLEIQSPSTLTLTQRLLGHRAQPLQARDAVRPVRDGKLTLSLFAPKEDEGALAGRSLIASVTGKEQLVVLPTPSTSPEFSGVIFPLSLDVPAGRDFFQVELLDSSSREPLARVAVDASPLPHLAYGVPDRSIEGFDVVERNGELALYSEVAEAAILASPGFTPREAIWLSIFTDFPQAISDQPILRTRRDTPAVAGGPSGFAALSTGSVITAAYTVTDGNGRHSFNVASGLNSLRLAPLAANPLEPAQDLFPRAGAFFPLNNARLLLTLEDRNEIRARASNMLPQWLRLGPIAPLPEFPDAPSSLSSFVDGIDLYLLVDQSLYRSTHPLHGWEPLSLEIPEDWREPLLRRDGDAWHLYGILQRNGRGIVCRATLNRTERGFQLQEATQP